MSASCALLNYSKQRSIRTLVQLDPSAFPSLPRADSLAPPLLQSSRRTYIRTDLSAGLIGAGPARSFVGAAFVVDPGRGPRLGGGRAEGRCCVRSMYVSCRWDGGGGMGRGSRPVSVDEAWLGGRTVGDSDAMGDGDAEVARISSGVWWKCFGWE